MRIVRLTVPRFRSLNDVRLDFSGPTETNEHVRIDFLAGRNGTGKSSALEAIGLIFASLSLEVDPGFAYDVEYELRSVRYRARVTNLRDAQRPTVERRTTPDAEWEDVERGSMQHIPDRVVGYSGGPGRGLSAALVDSLSHHLHADLDLLQLDLASADIPAADRRRLFEDRAESFRERHEELTAAPSTVFADNLHLMCPIAALVAHRGTGEHSDERYRQGRIDLLEHIGLDPDRPGVALSLRVRSDWQARVAQASARYLERLLRRATVRTAIDPDPRAPLESGRDFYAVLDLDDEQMAALPHLVGPPLSFCENLLAWQRAGALAHPELIVRKRGVEDALPAAVLSDGELLYAARYALLLMVPADSETLVLLDEPETHFNDLWKVHLVRDCLKMLDDGPSRQANHHVIIATHSDLTLTDAESNAVHVFEPDGRVRPPKAASFGATRSEVARVLFGVDARAGSHAVSRIAAAIARGQRAELEHLVHEVVGPGPLRFALEDRLAVLEEDEAAG